MPSRPAVVLISLLWLTSNGWIAWREWLPHWRGEPPAAIIDLADEAARNIPIRWGIYRGTERIGSLNTQFSYRDSDDSFEYVHHYRNLRLSTGGVSVEVPELKITMRLGRDGRWRGQTLRGEIVAQVSTIRLAAEISVEGVVRDGILQAQARLRSLLGEWNQELEPIPLAASPPLNPLMPLNRLLGLRPGQRWLVAEYNPLNEAIAAMLRQGAGQFGLTLPPPPRESLFAEVLSAPQSLQWNNEPVLCQVIEYRRGGELVARTWVHASDGRILKQEAFQQGEYLAIVRE